MIQEFLVAKDAEDALKLRRNNPRSIFYAGGTEINRLNSSVEAKTAVSLGSLHLDSIKDEEHSITIGSMVTFQQLVDSPLIPEWLKQAALYCGSFQRRNMATIGGNLALLGESSYLGPALLAARCRVLTASLTEGGAYHEENIPVREFHAYHKQFSGALLLGISLSKDGRYVGSARYSLSSQSLAAVTVGFGAMLNKEQVINHVRVFVAVKGSGLQRLNTVENSIENGELTTREDVQIAVAHNVQAMDDFTGGSLYKHYIASEGIGDLFTKFLKGGTQ